MLTTLAKYGKMDSFVASQVAPIISSVYNNAPKNKPFAFLAKDSMSKSVVKRYIHDDKAKRQSEVGFTNTFYDDEGWWGLAFIASWEMTGDIKYLNEAIYIWNNMHAGWGKTPCGGLYWNKNSNSPVVAISNGRFSHFQIS